MNISPENNLDYLAARYAQNVVKDNADENLITKALGVLQENGVYACCLYLLANQDKTIVPQMLALLEAIGLPELPASNKPADVLDYVAGPITANLPNLLLAKEVLEQMLIYARYGAKARGKDAK